MLKHFSSIYSLSFFFNFFSACCSNNQLWFDDFSSETLDLTKWVYETGDSWYNGEIQNYTSNNTYINNGKLVIEARKLEINPHEQNFIENQDSKKLGSKQAKNIIFTSSRIRSNQSWLFGKFEARIKLPKGQGFFPAFWLWPDDYDPQNYAEIDIMEAVGNYSKRIFSECWFFGDENKITTKNQSLKDNLTFYNFSQFDLSEDYDEGFHTYGAIWKKNEVHFFVDDKCFFSCSKTFGWNLNERNMHIILNFAIGGVWAGNPKESTKFPAKMEIDWVKVSQDISFGIIVNFLGWIIIMWILISILIY